MNETVRQTKAGRRYMAEMLGAIVLYAAVLMPAIWWINGNPESSWRWVVGLLPMVPVVLVGWSVLRYFQRLDELMRRQLTEAMAFSFASSALFVLTLGFLQVGGLPYFSVWWVWVGMGGSWLIGSLVTSLHYR